MEPDAVMEDPLPAPSSAIMAMFLGGESGGPAAAAASPPQPAPAAAPAPTAADAAQAPSTAQEQPQPAQAAPRGPTPPPAQQLLQQAATAPQHKGGMSRLDYETCAAMHSILAKYKEADPFRQPVDVEGLGIPDYYDIIKTPMDLKTVRDKLRAGRYKSIQDWRVDIQLIWDNARKYNGENHPVSSQAAKLEAAVDRRMEDAIEIAKANLSAEARGEPRPRKQNSIKMPPRSTDLGALLSSQQRSSDSDSMDEPVAMQRRSPEVQKGVVVKRERDADAAGAGPGPGRPAKRRLPAQPGGPSSSAAAPLNLDLESLAGMLNTPLARQLGAEEPDDLAFLALWKRFMTRKQQLTEAAGESEPLRAANKQLRTSLASALETIELLEARLKEEGDARVAAVAAKEEALAAKDSMEAELKEHKGLMEKQRSLLDQQQVVLRKLAQARRDALVKEGSGGGQQQQGAEQQQSDQAPRQEEAPAPAS